MSEVLAVATVKMSMVRLGRIDHFTVVCSVTWPLDGSEAGGDLVLIQTSRLLLCKTSCSDAVRSQRLKTMSMCVRLISVYRVYLVLYRAACWNVVLFNLFKIACQ